MTAYYNENDQKAAAWLRELIKAGHIAPGEVDERSIEDVCPDDLAGFAQCHFFAGIGGWSYALRLAGWPDYRPVWTGSCPRQPFSAAGKGSGAADSRHLWPDFWWLIAQRKPATVFGEQVAIRAGREWFAGVRADLETLGYAVGAADLCAASVGAPHIRQRLFWVADADCAGSFLGKRDGETNESRQPSPCWYHTNGRGQVCGVGNAESERRVWRQDDENSRRRECASGHTGQGCWMDLAPSVGRARVWDQPEHGEPMQAGAWSDATWLECADGKARRIEPGIEPLAHGVSGRVGLLRGYGNAIVPQVAAEFIRAAE